MKRAGRIHWIMLAGVVGIVAIAGLMLFNRESPETTATRFMTALVQGDDAKLSDLSYFPEGSKQELREQWKFATHVAGKNFIFAWRIKFSKDTGADSASVAMDFVRNALNNNAYPENFQLPLVKSDGKWLVDVRSISREMYPALPR